MNITLKQIEDFSRKYNQNPTNKQIEEKITKYGLKKTCINEEIIKQNPPIFNIELSETKRYDQKDSFKCWIFAGINVIKRNVSENLNINIMDLELSDNYIAFFDKLEKSNNVYEKVIHSKTKNLRQIQKNKILNNCVIEDGNWVMFLAILNKYGIVLKEAMPNTIESNNYEKWWEIYREKVKSDVVHLLEYKKKENDKIKLEEMKCQFLQENYSFLSKILGEPPLKFDYKYMNNNQEKVSIEKMTPAGFRKKYITLKLQDYIVMSNDHYGWDKEYNKKYRYYDYTNIYKKTDTELLNVTSKELKELTIKQLKDGIPVYIGLCFKRSCRDDVSGVLDTGLYKYEEDIGIRRLTKEMAMKLNETYIQHFMVLTGVHIENGKPIRWKVEDSYGDKEKVNGYYIMNDNYFDDFVITIIVDKKYLSESQSKLWEQKARLVK